MTEQGESANGRREFLKGVAIGSAALTGAAGAPFGRLDIATGGS
jgi:hypothetical protein